MICHPIHRLVITFWLLVLAIMIAGGGNLAYAQAELPQLTPDAEITATFQSNQRDVEFCFHQPVKHCFGNESVKSLGNSSILRIKVPDRTLSISVCADDYIGATYQISPPINSNLIRLDVGEHDYEKACHKRRAESHSGLTLPPGYRSRSGVRLVRDGINPVSFVNDGLKRYALVIGNENYENLKSLAVAQADSDLIAETLQGLGFKIFHGKALHDLTRSDFEWAIRNFIQEAADGDIVVFYYAGHGRSATNQNNYLFPKDAQSGDNYAELISVDGLNTELSAGRKRLVLIFLDACRSLEPPEGRAGEAIPGAGAGRNPPRDTAIIYAAKHGKYADDCVDYNHCTHSPFAEALSEILNGPEIQINDLFPELNNRVVERTNDRQEPDFSGSLHGNYHFIINPHS